MFVYTIGDIILWGIVGLAIVGLIGMAVIYGIQELATKLANRIREKDDDEVD